MQTLSKNITAGIFVCTILLVSCAKEGPMGPQGPPGNDGGTGPAGPQGATGSIDVIVDTFTVLSSSFRQTNYWYMVGHNSFRALPAKGYTRYNDKITQDILDKGMVLSTYKFVNTGFDNGWQTFPYSFIEYNSNYSHNFVDEVKPGAVNFYYYFEGIGGPPPNTIPTFQVPSVKIKLMIIPGKSLAQLNLNKNNVLNNSTIRRLIEN